MPGRYRYFCITECTYIYDNKCTFSCKNSSAHCIDRDSVTLLSRNRFALDILNRVPDTNDNLSRGYKTGHRIIFCSNEYICVYSSYNNAIWKQTTTTDTSQIDEKTNLYYTSERIKYDPHIVKCREHIVNTSNPHNVTKYQLGLGNVDNIKNNYNSDHNPSHMDDKTAGYTVGSTWININNDCCYICVDDTDMKAIWLKTTNIINTVKSLGNGESVLVNKMGVGMELIFRSLVAGNNITLESSDGEIKINSTGGTVSNQSFILSSTIIEAISVEYDSILYFPWKQSFFEKIENMGLIVGIEIKSHPLSIKVVDDNNTELGELIGINESGIYTIGLGNPSRDTIITIKIKTTETNTNDYPCIYSVLLYQQQIPPP